MEGSFKLNDCINILCDYAIKNIINLNTIKSILEEQRVPGEIYDLIYMNHIHEYVKLNKIDPYIYINIEIIYKIIDSIKYYSTNDYTNLLVKLDSYNTIKYIYPELILHHDFSQSKLDELYIIYITFNDKTHFYNSYEYIYSYIYDKLYGDMQIDDNDNE